MSDTYTMTIESTPAPEDVKAVWMGLDAYNRQHAGDDAFQSLTLLVRDPEGAVVGGLLGATYWSWLVIEILWLAEGVRGDGWGSQLLRTAEQIAIERGCHAAHLDTVW
jgi:GNAT superfamily N-acetyltransferase